MRSKMKSFTSVLLVFVLISGTHGLHKDNRVSAAEKYITVEQFAELIVDELDITTTTTTTNSENSGYVNALLDKGIIKEGDFTSYNKNITRGDALVVLNRADEYLYGNKLDEKLIQTVIDKRISDINKVKEEKRVDVAKAYIKGYMKGYSNGAYCTDRKLKVTSKITKAGAENIVKMLNDKKLRAKISPDGQLIRTTNLPKNYKLFPYILASYPNKYYEWKLRCENPKLYGTDYEEIKLVHLVDYASPAEIDKLKIEKYDNFKKIKDENIDMWVEKAKKHLELVFNANYKTISDEWVEDLMSTSFVYKDHYEHFVREQVDTYYKDMKKNKTIVEADTIAVDGSTLYSVNGDFYLRAYVKYKVISSKVSLNPDTDTMIRDYPHNKILFSPGFVDLSGTKLGEWTEGYFDIHLCENGSSIGNMGIVGGLYYKGQVLN